MEEIRKAASDLKNSIKRTLPDLSPYKSKLAQL